MPMRIYIGFSTWSAMSMGIYIGFSTWTERIDRNIVQNMNVSGASIGSNADALLPISGNCSIGHSMKCSMECSMQCSMQ